MEPNSPLASAMGKEQHRQILIMIESHEGRLREIEYPKYKFFTQEKYDIACYPEDNLHYGLKHTFNMLEESYLIIQVSVINLV